MMSAFLVRVVVFSDMAWAMALSSSRSLPSRTERSSCCSAVIGLLFRRGLSPARNVRAWRGETGRRKDSFQEPSPDHLCEKHPGTVLVPAESASKRSGDVITLAGTDGHCQHPQ